MRPSLLTCCFVLLPIVLMEGHLEHSCKGFVIWLVLTGVIAKLTLSRLGRQ